MCEVCDMKSLSNSSRLLETENGSLLDVPVYVQEHCSPFLITKFNGKYYLQCGYKQLIIKYCPVCGKELK